MEIKIQNTDEIFDYLKGIEEKRAKEVVGEATMKAYENLRFFAKPHFSGVHSKLERNITHKIKNLAGIVWIKPDEMMVNWRGKRLNYVEFVIHGTKPHTIKAKNKKALRFSSLGKFIYAKSVQHPGYKGDDFMQKAVEKTFDDIQEMLR